MNASTSRASQVALVALPWSRRDRPSAAIAALAAFIRQQRPDVSVTCHYAYVRTAREFGDALYDAVADDCYRLGEILYAPLLYPQQRASCAEKIKGWISNNPSLVAQFEEADASKIFDRLEGMLEQQLEDLIEEVAASKPTLIGLTTCFGQLFANLAFAERIHKRLPDVRIVLGGSTVSGRVGPSLIAEYPQVDFIIQGEGEQPMVALLESMLSDSIPDAAGILARDDANRMSVPARLWEVPNMDALPVPNFDEYAAAAEEAGIEWTLPIEGSRGCWWDRTKRTGNPKSTCYFCNLNVQWNGYREKSSARIADELDALTNQYKILRIFFLDNIIRHKGADELAERIKKLDRDYTIFYEMRANIKSHEMLALWEAGLRTVQLGIEALDTSVLRRIGKGTTLMQNLHAMRLCTEFGVVNDANLITHFPGTTAAEISATCENLQRFALSFHPLQTSPFHLGVESTLDTIREGFGIRNIRNDETYKVAMPLDVWNRTSLFNLEFDYVDEHPSWAAVEDMTEKWAELHRQSKSNLLLLYRDGVSFLIVEDTRYGDFRSGRFEGVDREIYLYCMEPRSIDQLVRRFGDSVGRDEAAMREQLRKFTEFDIMFEEDGHFLSLAVATQPSIAARRIRGQLAESEQRKGAAKSKLALPVVEG